MKQSIIKRGGIFIKNTNNTLKCTKGVKKINHRKKCTRSVIKAC